MPEVIKQRQATGREGETEDGIGENRMAEHIVESGEIMALSDAQDVSDASPASPQKLAAAIRRENNLQPDAASSLRARVECLAAGREFLLRYPK